MSFHAIGGLPRSGSTLLCNILCQNPRFHASSTSNLAQLLSAARTSVSVQPETKSDLAADRAQTEARIERVFRAIVDAWYAHVDLPAVAVFDKGRLWGHMHRLFHAVEPEGKLICCVRDPRAVFASLERQERRFPYLVNETAPAAHTLAARATAVFGPDGMVGGPLAGLEDLLMDKPDYVLLFQYEYLAEQPEEALRKLYAALEEDWFEHDFESVQNMATDLDPLYLNKFPHDGSGKVAPPAYDWSEYVPDEVAQMIMQQAPRLTRRFRY